MRIGVIGGRHRNAAQLAQMAAGAGHELELHEGDVHGRGAGEVRCLVARSDLVVIVTGINSHGGVNVAKKAARQLRRPTLVIDRLGTARLSRLLEALQARRHDCRSLGAQEHEPR